MCFDSGPIIREQGFFGSKRGPELYGEVLECPPATIDTDLGGLVSTPFRDILLARHEQSRVIGTTQEMPPDPVRAPAVRRPSRPTEQSLLPLARCGKQTLLGRIERTNPRRAETDHGKR